MLKGSWIEDQTRTFEYKGVKYYTRTDPDGWDKGQIQVWTVDGNHHMGTFQKDKTKPFQLNDSELGVFINYDVETYKAGLELKKDPKAIEGLSKAARTSSEDTVISVTRKTCMDNGGSASECQKQAVNKSDDIALTEEQVQAKATVEREEEEAAKAAQKQAQDQEERAKEMKEDLEKDVGRPDYGGPMQYPEGRDNQDYMLFEVLKYTPRGLKNSDGSGGPLKSRSNRVPIANRGKGDRKPIAEISLPIPANIQDANNVSWQKDDIDELSKHLASWTGGALTGNVTGNLEDLQATLKKTNSVDAARLAILNSITGVKAMQREKGAVFNENTELLFSGPGLRRFSFNFRLSPRSASEAKMVQRIIRTFKESMSAKKSQEFFFIKAPNTYWISYMSGETNQPHPWLNRFKECALTNMTVQYAPDGTYATFPDGAMTSYSMQLEFSEIEPVFNTDYEESGKENIGY